MSFKQEKVIVIISEFVNDKREFYLITNVPVEKARFFYKDDDGLFKVMASSDYAVRTELNETRLYITNVEIKEKSTKFQVGYEINFTSSEYETSLPVLSVLVEMYNNLIEDSRTIFNYVKKQCFISDDKTTSLVLPNLPAYTVWCMGENGEMFALPVSELYSKFGEMLNKLKSILADYTESKKEEIRGATFFPHLMEDGTLSWTNDKNKPNPEPVNIKGPAGTIENVTASVNSNTGVPSVKVTMSGTKENRSFDLEFRNLKGDKPIKGTDYYTQQEKEQFTAETLKLVTDEGNKQISLTQAEALKVIEQLKKLVEGNPETSNAQTLSGKTRVEFENDVSNSFKYHFKKVIPVEETLQDGYLISNGNYDNTNNYHSKTLTFKCQDGEMFLYKGEGRGDAQSYLMKKGNTIVSYGQFRSENKYTKIKIEKDIDNIIFSSFNYKNKEIILDVIKLNASDMNSRISKLEVNFTENILSNKKWAVFGDSFTYGDGVGVFTDGNNIGKNKVYPYHINNRTGIEVIKFFEGGRTLAYPKDGTFTNSITCPTVSYYYQNVPVDVDYITIYLGINDSHHATGSSGTDGEIVTGVIPIGTIDDTDTSTYYGAWNVVLTWLIEHRPFAHIGIIVSNGCDTPEYRTAQLSIAKKYGIPYIDLNGDERTPVMIRSQNQEISKLVRDIITKKQSVDYDGTATGKTNRHPNEEAHLYESYFIENFLRSL